MFSSLLVPEFKVKFNARIKHYEGFNHYSVFSREVFNPTKAEAVKVNKVLRKRRNSVEGEHRMDNMKRAKDKAYDIAFANDFKYFVTFTLNEQFINRYDKDEVLKRLRDWLDYRVRKCNLKYLIFPEYHKDGAIHFHGLMSGDIKIMDSGLKTGRGQIIYSAESWQLGFSSVIILEKPYERVVNYVMKYISKQDTRVFGKYYFAGGRGLKREVPATYQNIDYLAFPGKPYQITDAGMSVKYLREDI